MKLKYIFIPAILLTILAVGICKHYYNLELLSMDYVCMICVTCFVAFFTIFFGISVCAYEASKTVAEKQNEHIDKYIQFLTQYVNECFTAHDALTKDIITQQSIEVVESLKKVGEIIVSGDDQRAKILTNLLVDIKSISIWARDHSLVAKNASCNCEMLAKEAIERLDNVLICLREDEVENDVEDVEEDEIKVIGE